MKELLIASDHAGFALKAKLSAYLKGKGIKVNDLGTYSPKRCDYPEFAYKLAKLVSDGKYQRGILACKSGIGDSIVANKLPRVRAALCYNLKAAKLSREHNDSNVLVLGSAFVKMELVKKIAMAWLRTPFAGGRHARRVNQIKAIEKKIRSERK
ncbi:MAG: ribose 5-phosphate isomerase B [Candidatus Omnitrophota bacterium]